MIVKKLKAMKTKLIKIFSNGSILFSYDSFINLKQIKIYEKDYKNFFLFKKEQTKNFKKSDSLLTYKNQYL